MSHAKTSYFLTECLLANLLDGMQIDDIAASVALGFSKEAVWDLVDFLLGIE